MACLVLRTKTLFFFMLVVAGCVLAGTLLTPRVFAQETGQTAGDITLSISPEIPGPSEPAQITLTSYFYDLNVLPITWTEDGKATSSGTGQKTYSLTTPPVGQTKRIRVRVKTGDGADYIKQIVITPSDIDLLWESVDGYTPPFYKGKTLPTTESIVRFVAIPSFSLGKKTSSGDNTNYSWRRNYNAVSASSGYGKRAFTFKMSYLNKVETVSVSAVDVGTGATASKTFDLKEYSPKIIFYEKDPLYGVLYNNAVTSSITVSKNDKILIAEPYFVSPRSILNGDLHFSWKLNNKTINTPEVENQIVLRRGDNTGTANLSLSIESASRLFLELTKSLTINLE